uniref:Bm13628 n=1 Tax=Brugia malayi TaxID=6279 RepID=A0A1I9G5T2_BRUMA|nr:Bm13628 [Brugia malayi]
MCSNSITCEYNQKNDPVKTFADYGKTLFIKNVAQLFTLHRRNQDSCCIL